MSLQRLRRILNAPMEVAVESSAGIVASVAAAAAERAHLSPKTPAVYQPLVGASTLSFRPIDFLRKIGELTTPKGINLSRLAASWATRRYFWAIADGGAVTSRFRLSGDARRMDRHQKTLLSDEFGMGFGGLIAERLLQAPDYVDVDYAVTNPAQYFGARAQYRRRPDFLMWGNNTPLFVVECKGSQTTLSSVVGQLRRGLEQLPSIEVGNAPKVALVIATHLQPRGTTVYVVDPEDDSESGSGRRKKVDASIDRVGRGYSVSDMPAFREKLRLGADLSRLRWAGLHASADRLEESITGRRSHEETPNVPLERIETDVGEFLGSATPAVPELGGAGPLLFRGVRADLLSELPGDGGALGPPRATNRAYTHDDPRFSASESGTCLAILDLPE